MRIAVLVKQIPRPSQLRLVDGALVRDGVELETNAYCRRGNARAVELAGTDGEVVVFSMGPPAAERTVREMVACGAHRGVLVCDPLLAGSDTLVTARVLAAAIAAEGRFDLVFTGAYSLDSETGHIGVQVAELLGLPFVGPCQSFEVLDGVAVATVGSEGGVMDVEVLLPVVAAAAERLCAPSKGTPEQISAVPAERIRRVGVADLGLDPVSVGLAASPTRVEQPARTATAVRRRRFVTDSVGAALAALDELARSEEPTASVTDPAVPPTGEERGAVWCLPDPTLGVVDEDLVGAVLGVAGAAGRTVTLVVRGGGAAGPLQRVSRVLELSGPDAPEDWRETLARRLQEARPHCLIVEATNWGREVAARVAARLGWGLVGDAVDLTVDGGDVVAWKSALSGQAVVPISSSSPTLLATVRPGALSGSIVSARGSTAVDTDTTTSRSRVIYSPVRDVDLAGRELLRAERIVVVGAGVPPEGYPVVEELRALLGAGPLGATRKVTDRGWLPRSRQIGITGRAVGPELLVSIGTNGGLNHALGFGRATRVLAINSDPEALIFEQADVGIIGDWRAVVDRLCVALRARGDSRGPAHPGDGVVESHYTSKESHE